LAKKAIALPDAAIAPITVQTVDSPLPTQGANMLKFIVAGLCGIALTGSVYMAGWGSSMPPTQAGATCDECDSAAVKEVAFKVPEGKTDMKNTKCIVQADDVGDGKEFVVYKDQVFHICCKDCEETFNKDPEKYVKAFEKDPAKFGVKK
jgi:hypothetical protein